MYTVKTSIHFDAAHRLTFHEGACKRLHGHRWIVEVYLHSKRLNKNMVMDFKDIKNIMKQEIERNYDHKTILFRNDYNKELIELLTKTHEVVTLNFEPTAENLAKNFYENLKYILKRQTQDHYLKKVRIYESPTSWAEYEEK